MAVAAYGATNPAGTDPWPIESVLAKEALSGNPTAHMMLSNYQQAREADSNLYNKSMEGQHEFARQQLIAQMQEARNKLIPELVGKPGGGAFLAGGGIEGVGPSASGNAAAWAGLGQAGQQHDFATNLAEQGKGVESLSRAGQDVAIQQIPGLQNFQTTGAGEHSDIAVERIKAATALQLAAQKAKTAGAGGGTGTGFTVGFDVPNAFGGTDHVSAGKKIGQAQIDAYRQAHGMSPVDPATPAQALPDVAGAQSTARSRTSLPPASTTPQNSAAGVAAAQRQVMANMDKMRNHPSYPDLVAGMKANGGKPIVKIENGAPVLYGASGKPL